MEDPALYDACLDGRVDEARRRLAQGTDPNAVKADGGCSCPVLHAAAISGSEEIVGLLLDAGAAVDQPTEPKQNTPLWAAARNDREGVLVRLLAAGATVDGRNYESSTPLQIAAQLGYARIVARLLEAGADTHNVSRFGSNVVWAAAYSGSAEAVRLLLERGADPSVRTNPDIGEQSNTNALDIAERKGHVAAAALLRQALQQRERKREEEVAAAAAAANAQAEQARQEAAEAAAAAQFSQVTGADAATARIALERAGGDLVTAVTAFLAAQEAATASAPEPDPAPRTPSSPVPSGSRPPTTSTPTSAEEADPPELDAWLASVDLGRFAPQVKEYGYETLRVLRAATEADIVEMTEDADIGMKKPLRRLFLTEWKALVAAPAHVALEPEPEPEPQPQPQPQPAIKQQSHGQAVQVMQPSDEFDFVFSNKTASDGLCLSVRAKLTARGLRVWQQKTNIPKDSDNWFNEWFPSAVKSRKIVCFISVDYLKSPYCMKEFTIGLASHKLLVVACEPLAQINAVDPSAYPYASNALAYLLGGGQVIFHDTEDVVAEILKFA